MGGGAFYRKKMEGMYIVRSLQQVFKDAKVFAENSKFGGVHSLRHSCHAFIISCLLLVCHMQGVAQSQDIPAIELTLKRIQAEWHHAYVVSDSAKLSNMLSS